MKVLVVVDMQNDFIDGALGSKQARAIVGNVKEKIAQYKNEGETVVFTRDTHYENYFDTQEGQKLPVPHCIKGTDGWEISPALESEGCKVIDKPTFGSVELGEYLKTSGELEKVELIGLCTDICVISNALLIKANMPEVPVFVDSSCCAGVTPESHENALDAMKMCQINII